MPPKNNNNRPKPIILCILDGWGAGPDAPDNAISKGNTPNFDRFMRECPNSLLETSGQSVGLPEGQMGNSEVGHMAIGSGRVILQDLPRIDRAIKDGSLEKNPELIGFIEKLKKTGGRCHLLGLCSDGGVHAHIDHIIALARMISANGIEVFIHAITDGRDTSPESAMQYLERLESDTQDNDLIKVATVIGRYYAMDRDKRWDRVSLAYDAIISGTGIRKSTWEGAIKDSYKLGKTDEFIVPAVIGQYNGAKDGDGVIMANFRADRAREIMESLIDPKFAGFKRGKIINFKAKLGMVGYSEKLDELMPALFKPEKIENILPEIISSAGMKQLRIAETEKYAHVTFFFSGGREREYPGEERILIPSPKVATYDLQPEMSAPEVAEKLVAAIDSGKFDFIVCNFANADMVGHSGNFAATKKAIEAVDECLGKIAAALDKIGGAMLITADHGNAEQMSDAENHSYHTQHTLNPVLCIIYGLPGKISLKNGSLPDIAPTLLEIMGLPKPKEMTGTSLIDKV